MLPALLANLLAPVTPRLGPKGPKNRGVHGEFGIHWIPRSSRGMTSEKQGGYVLLPVAIAIALIGVLAFLIASESAIEVNATSGEFEAVRADYVAQAGLQHGLQLAAQQGCGPYTDLFNVPFSDDKYGTSLTTDLGSTTPYTITVDQDGWIRDDDTSRVHATDTRLHFRSDGVTERPVYRYDLSSIPAQTPILSAVAWFYLNKEHPEGPIEIRALTSDWTETNASWDQLGDAMGSEVLARIPTQPNAGLWVAVNLSPQVQAWVNGVPNFGITLNSRGDGAHGEYLSRESSFPPYLEVIAGTPPSPLAKLKSVGSLSNGTSRTLLRDVTLRQPAPAFYELQPDGAGGFDASMNQNKPDNNFGAGPTLWVQDAAGVNDDNSVIWFNMGVIPYGAEVVEASLELHQFYATNPASEVGVHRLRQYFIEGVNDDAPGSGVTWNRYQDGSNWGSPGGDFDGLAISTTSIPSNTTGPVSWDITGLVQGWVDGSYPNFGLILTPESPGTDVGFRSSEHTVAGERPRLRVTYRCSCGRVCQPPQGSGGRIVMIGNWPGSLPDSRDLEKEAIIESWGYQIDHADDNSIWTINFNNYDLVYVSETASSAAIQGQLDFRSIGAVIEQGNAWDDFNLSNEDDQGTGFNVDVVDNSHYITAPFALGALQIYDRPMEILTVVAPIAQDLQILVEDGGDGSLTILDDGATSLAGPAAGKRVTLPLGRDTNSDFNWNYLNANGRLLVQRSIEWAMGGGSLPSIGNLLLVVNNDSSLTTQEIAKRSLFDSWGWAVSVIDSGDNQGSFDAATAANDVVYVGEDIVASDLGNKLVNATIGVVIEENNLADEFGFADGINWGSGTDLKLVTSHYITSTLPTGAGTILTTAESLSNLTGNQAPDIQLIGFNGVGPSLAALDNGAALNGGGNAAGRRVIVPWGGNNMDINHLNDDGRTILQRSLEWANGSDLDFSPLAHWKLDEPGGSIAVDSAGGHDGTLTNGPEWSAGMLEGGLAYDGIDDAIIVPHTDTLSLTEAMTFTAWVKSNAFGVDGPYDLVVSKGTVATSYAYYFGALNDEIIFGFSAGGSYREFVTPNLNLATDTWHHLAATFDNASNRVRLYHNGVEVLATTTTYEPSATTHDLYVGSSEDGADWDGELDDVRIYPRALDPTEIVELAERPGPMAHWRFDEGSGNIAVDEVGGHDATITNPVWDPGQDGGAIRVLSLNEAGAAPHDDTLSLTRGLTLMAWVSKANLTGYDTAIDKASSGADINYFLGTWYDEIVFGFSTATDNWQGYYTSGVNLSTGSWDHIAASFDNAANEVRIYRNGSLVQTWASTLEPLTNNGNLWLGRSALTSEFLSGRLDDARIYPRVLDASEIQQVYDDTAGGGGAGGGYVEANQSWSATTSNAWQTVDLAGFGVPANAIVEVVVENTSTTAQREGGVRAVGSALDRRFDLQEAEGGGVDAMTLHVQADASSRIQHFAENAGNIRFRMVGYWTAGSYSDRDVLFTAGASNSWQTRSLSAYGVAPGQIVEIMAQNNNGSNEYRAGVRASGSSNSETFDLHEAEAGGRDFLTLFVEAGSDAAASIEVFAENNGEIEFKVVGVWDTPPGTYTEARAVLGNPTADSNWQTIDLSGFGVPPNSVAQIVMANRFASAQNRQGVRSVGNGLPRYIDIHEAENGGEDLVTMHVPVDGSSQIQWMHQDVSDAHRYYLAGWWVLP